MESSDDDGDSATATMTKATLIFLFILPAALYKPHQKQEPFFNVSDISVRKEAKATPVPEPEKPKKKKKKLYITFDDGPNRGTKNVLTIVKDEQVPVSFFIVGEHVFASPTQAQLWDSLKMAKQIDLCNHSFSHADGRYEKFYKDPENVVADFRKTEDTLQLEHSIARTPGRNIWRIDTIQFTDLKKSAVAADSLQKAGFVLMGWDLEWHFDHTSMSVTTTAEKLVSQIDSAFKHNKTINADHLVLLAHDQAYVKSEDSLQLRLFLQLLKQKDEYELAMVSAYPGAVRKAADSVRLKVVQ
jgi:peptidoglycan-N-acetylglucosamine deacetylase